MDDMAKTVEAVWPARADSQEASGGGPRPPLARFKVLDLTRARAGPTAVRQLADWGADVIKIESPGDNPDAPDKTRHGFDFNNLHRNKRGITLNLKDDAARAVFMKLAAAADVIVENYRPGVKHRLGISYDAVRKVNPRIVYGSISGFGQEGPYKDRAGLDQIAQGLGGLMSVTGLPGQGPVRVGIPIADLCAGNFLAQGILIALLEREVSGEGQWVHTSLLEAMIQMMDFQAARYLKDGEVPGQAGNDHPTSVPAGLFPTSDGAVNIQASAPNLFQRLSDAVGLPDLPKHPDYSEPKARSDNRVALHATIGEKTAEKPSGHWVETLAKAGVPCGPVYSLDQTFGDAQVAGLNMGPTVTHPVIGETRILGQAVKLDRTRQRMRNATPGFGADTDSVLAALGYDAAEIAGMRDKGVI